MRTETCTHVALKTRVSSAMPCAWTQSDACDGCWREELIGWQVNRLRLPRVRGPVSQRVNRSVEMCRNCATLIFIHALQPGAAVKVRTAALHCAAACETADTAACCQLTSIPQVGHETLNLELSRADALSQVCVSSGPVLTVNR